MDKEIALEETTPTEQPNEQTVANDLPVQDEGESMTDEPKELKIPIKYNKQHIELSVEQASELAQKGMKFDDMRSVMDKLSYLSASTGKSTQRLIDDLFDEKEKELSDRVREMAGDDEALFSKLLEYEHSKHQKAYEKVLGKQSDIEDFNRNAENERIAEQFIELSKEFPEIEKVSAVPKQTFEIALKNNISLFDAHLRYKHYEDAKIKRAEKEQEFAALSSAGSQQSSAISTDNVQDALIKGIWSKN